MKRTLYYVVTLWLILWAQVVSNHLLGGTLFSVQWILLCVLHFGLRRGPWVGECMGFVWGLFIDASSLGLLGLHAILYSLAGYAAGMFRRQLDSSKIFTQTILTWMASVVYFSVYMIIGRFFSIEEGPFHWSLLTIPVMNALFAPLVFRMLEMWALAWDMQPEERS